MLLDDLVNIINEFALPKEATTIKRILIKETIFNKNVYVVDIIHIFYNTIISERDKGIRDDQNPVSSQLVFSNGYYVDYHFLNWIIWDSVGKWVGQINSRSFEYQKNECYEKRKGVGVGAPRRRQGPVLATRARV